MVRGGVNALKSLEASESKYATFPKERKWAFDDVPKNCTIRDDDEAFEDLQRSANMKEKSDMYRETLKIVRDESEGQYNPSNLDIAIRKAQEEYWSAFSASNMTSATHTDRSKTVADEPFVKDPSVATLCHASRTYASSVTETSVQQSRARRKPPLRSQTTYPQPEPSMSPISALPTRRRAG
jgi:hypothetical protein